MGKEGLSNFRISGFSRASTTNNKCSNQNTTITKFAGYSVILKNVMCYLVMLQKNIQTITTNYFYDVKFCKENGTQSFYKF